MGDASVAEALVDAWLTARLRGTPRTLSLTGWPRVVLTPVGRVQLQPENQVLSLNHRFLMPRMWSFCWERGRSGAHGGKQG